MFGGLRFFVGRCLALERDLQFLRKVPVCASILIGNLTKKDARAKEGCNFFTERVTHSLNQRPLDREISIRYDQASQSNTVK